MATYSATGQHWDFYEIDPVVRLASNPRYFSFLSDCASCARAPYRMVLGDARLRLEEAPGNHYRLIVLDAFTSDSVPAHLLTTQALELYLPKLAGDGVVFFHISTLFGSRAVNVRAITHDGFGSTD